MARVKRRKRFCLPIVAALLLFLAVGVAVVLASLRGPMSALKEPPEVITKRLSRENNAWYALVEATKLLPKAPEALILKDESGWDYEYMPEPDSLGAILKIRRPDNDTVLLEFVAKSKPATDLALKALDKPWFLNPPRPNKGPQTEKEKMWAAYAYQAQWWTAEERRAMWMLVRLLQARALTEPCVDPSEADGCQRLIESVRLAGLLNQDGIQEQVLNPRLGVNIIRKTSPEHQKRLSGELAEMGAAYVPGRDLDVRLKALYAAEVSDLLPGDFDPMGKAVISGMLLRQQVFASRHEALLRRAAGMIWRQYDELRKKEPALVKAEEVIKWHRIVPDMQFQNSLARATANGMPAALALELFKQDNGTYPESLEALVPKYLAAQPRNPFTGGPFNYARTEKDYALSCTQKSDDIAINNKELVFHAP